MALVDVRTSDSIPRVTGGVEDGLGRESGADRAPVSARGARYRAHFGSAQDDVRLDLLTAAARQKLAAGQCELPRRPFRTRPV